ncbi:hypothetical protein MPER_00268, partial [Moniliophthora perniciosa FA553]
MPGLGLKPNHITLDLSANNGPKDAKVVAVPLPKKTVGIVFAQRTGTSSRQHLNTYLLDVNISFATAAVERRIETRDSP